MRLVTVHSLFLFVVCVIFIWSIHGIAYGIVPDQYEVMADYCLEHADREAAGDRVINDLVGSGLVDTFHQDKTCVQIFDEKRLEDFKQKLVDACEIDPDCGGD